jgi:NADH dehydrogenase (ubiquinone) 1 beta subcomplex subunit 9
MASTAGYLARRAAQKERVRLLYRRALKDTLNWAVHRHLFYQDVSSPFLLSNLDLILLPARGWI